ncbi:middle tumor antigen [Castor fiber polyomavirus 1]
MDRILCREEKHELITLLDLPPQCWGNLPMMKSYYKKMCLVHHPDKGGDLLKMMRMNELWQKLQNNILELRTESSSSYFSQVSTFCWDELDMTCGEYYGKQFDQHFMKIYPTCLIYTKKCNCLVSKLRQQHAIRRKKLKKKCLVWGECFCYGCYLIWFGFPDSEECFLWWKQIIKDTEFRLILICKYYTWGSCMLKNCCLFLFFFFCRKMNIQSMGLPSSKTGGTQVGQTPLLSRPLRDPSDEENKTYIVMRPLETPQTKMTSSEEERAPTPPPRRLITFLSTPQDLPPPNATVRPPFPLQDFSKPLLLTPRRSRAREADLRRALLRDLQALRKEVTHLHLQRRRNLRLIIILLIFLTVCLSILVMLFIRIKL